ncbi:hypothetical protein QJS04_geneDACA000033 [Acorus gramineus]|uniref:Uncharacterized protein n=1 Tax=Acorus gramineus TaxID=55184 RepID=A0AAV9AT91_ACOGR|nr:hypothetical protein QJS04_geneDACA000033 [Acorus gramineus]
MGCFLACFGGPKEQKRRRRLTRTSPPRNQVHGDYGSIQPTLTFSPKELPLESPVVSVLDLKEKAEGGSIKKKVSFNLGVTTYSEVPAFEDTNESEKEREIEVAEEKGQPNRAAKTSSPGAGPFGSNHRYANWAGSDDDEDAGFKDCKCDDDEEDDGDISDACESDEEEPEESYDSVFSLPIDRVRQFSPPTEVFTVGGCSPSVLPNRAVRDRSQYVHPVLNPVENLSQWKSVKSKKPTLEKHPRKENIDAKLELEVPFSPEPTFKIKKAQIPFYSEPRLDFEKPPKQEISVDASLSNWLVPPVSKIPPRTSISGRSGSTVSKEDRPILGALTLEEIKLASVNSSPRRSPSRSPDEMPILGTVGSYWRSEDQCPADLGYKGIPNTTSKYREVCGVVRQ